MRTTPGAAAGCSARTGHQALRRRGRRRRSDARHRARRVLLPARAIRLRQDHHAAHDRRLRGGHLRDHLPRRRGSDRAAAVQARHEHGLPELRALPPPQRLRERRLRAAPAQDRRRSEIRHQVEFMLKLVELPGYETRKPHQLSGGQQQRIALARALDQPSQGAAPRRAARRARPEAPQADAGRAEAHPERDRHHLHLRHPRPGRGDDDVRSHRGHAQWPRSSSSGHRRSSTSDRRPSSWPGSWASATSSTARWPRRARPCRSCASATGPCCECRRHRSTAAAAERAHRRAAREAPSSRRWQRAAAPSPTAVNSLDGRILDASYIGVSTQYLIETPTGQRVTVYAQNLETGGASEAHADGQRVRLTWRPEHTFVIGAAEVASTDQAGGGDHG